MIGFYNYTVILTYLSLLSAGTGILVSLSGNGHPYWGVFFLLLCGLFDAFDGQVARTKKDRSDMEASFGIQIDSLSDLVAFGVLPACIGVAMLPNSHFLENIFNANPLFYMVVKCLCFAIGAFYILSALIRLAYFNVTEEERQRTEEGARKYYTGLPVTSAALIFPSVMLFRYILPFDISLLYTIVMIITGFMFLGRFQLRKPKLRGILFLILIGVLECVALIVFLYFNKWS
ncbi:MAG: CDP-alcohol phosphatidyltransferase family protein [Clostridia bacterium]|nr:CDP-alcohol phosphatidyltransferase family protein [Clostridia bacterium]